MTNHTATLDLPGEVLRPGDAGYDDASRTFAGPATPALLVRPTDAGEVAAAMRYAAAHGLPVSVRSGGHGPLGAAVHDGALVIDLRRLDGVDLLDEETRVVRIGAGATWGAVAERLRPHGLGVTAGDTTSVGVGGLLVGGGIGWMVREHGLAIDNLVGAEVVTVGGRVLRIDETEHEDLFWAVRGGGGNVAVVLSFDVVAHPVSDVTFGTITYEPDDPGSLLRGWRDHMRTAPDELTTTLTLMPAMGGGPARAMVGVCYTGDDPATALDPLTGLAPFVATDLAPRPYADVLADAHHPPGMRMAVTNRTVRDLDDAAIAALTDTIAGAPPAAVNLRSLGGAVARVPAAATAFAHRDAEVLLTVIAFLPPDAPGGSDALAPWAPVLARGEGAYVNFLGAATEADLAAAYPPATRARLAAIKGEHDPGNVLRRNHNVAPSGVGAVA